MKKNIVNVEKIIAEDAKHRFDGVKDDLFDIFTLGRSNQYEINLPILTSSSHFRSNYNTLEFKRVFYQQLPELKDIPMDNLFVAGGFISSILTKEKNGNILKDIDVDIFVYGLDEKAATTRVETFLNDLFKQKEKISSGNKIVVDVMESKYALSIVIDGRKYQIVTRLYKTTSEVLHSFDMGSSAVGFDGKNVYCTSLGRLALEHHVNVLDLSRRSPTYEQRLKKYFERGFDIVLPELHFEKLRRKYLQYGEHEMLIMPHMQIVYDKIFGNKIRVKKMLLSKEDTFTRNSSSTKHPYESWSGWQKKDIINLNIRKILKNYKSEKLYKVQRQILKFDESSKIFKVKPCLSKQDIIDKYEWIKANVLKSGNFQFSLIEKYVTIESLETVGKIAFQLNADDRKKYIKELLDIQLAVLLNQFESITKEKKPPIEWSNVNINEQCFIPAKEWYGFYFKAQYQLKQ